MCEHRPPCPSADAADRDAAHVVSRHSQQGWSLLCNGVITFDDGGDLLPDGRAVPPPSAVRGRPITSTRWAGGRSPSTVSSTVTDPPALVRRARCGRPRALAR